MNFTVERYGSLNVLFNNVGLTNLKKDLDVLNIDLDEWDRLVNVNLKSILLGSRFAIPHMQKRAGAQLLIRLLWRHSPVTKSVQPMGQLKQGW